MVDFANTLQNISLIYKSLLNEEKSTEYFNKAKEITLKLTKDYKRKNTLV